MVEALEVVAAALGAGANGMIALLAYVAFKHELRITKLEGGGRA